MTRFRTRLSDFYRRRSRCRRRLQTTYERYTVRNRIHENILNLGKLECWDSTHKNGVKISTPLIRNLFNCVNWYQCVTFTVSVHPSVRNLGLQNCFTRSPGTTTLFVTSRTVRFVHLTTRDGDVTTEVITSSVNTSNDHLGIESKKKISYYIIFTFSKTKI